MTTVKHERLDHYLVRTGSFRSRDRSKEAILRGNVRVNGMVQRKPSFLLEENSVVELLVVDSPYVSRSALKLRAALDQFRVPVQGAVALDIGVATGGFSQLLLERGARMVYGIDVGNGQVAAELLHDRRFVFRNNTDARDLRLADFSEPPDLIVVDVSFISIEALLPALSALTGRETILLVLLKPQYELGPGSLQKLKDLTLVKKRLLAIENAFAAQGLKLTEKMPSPLKGKEGTQEYLWLFRRRIS